MIKTRKFRIFKVSLIIFLVLLSQYAVFHFVPVVRAADTTDYVDNNTSDVDSHAGHGTHSSFLAMQAGPDSTNDTLTEALTSGGTTSDVFTSGFEEGPWNDKWNDNGATTWLCGTSSTPGSPWAPHSGTNMSYALNANDGNLISDNIDLSGASQAGVSFWYMVDDEEATDYRFYYYNGTAYVLQSLDLGLAANEDAWYKYSEIITDSQYLISNFRIDFNSQADTNEGSFVDDVVVNKTLANNYELDLEFQWTTAVFNETSEYLCIYTGTVDAEALKVDVWNGASWTNIIASLSASQWNNVSIGTYLTSETITFRFLGETETGDTSQSTWQIDCALLYTHSSDGWLSGWSYRRSHVINNATGAGTLYQTRIIIINGTTEGVSTTYVTNDTITINNKMRSDFGDVRFTNSSGTGLLDCWMETLNTGVNATFWVEVADDLSTVAATIYVYYGKSDATTTSNGENTFLFFDDFLADLSKWTVVDGTWTIQGDSTVQAYRTTTGSMTLKSASFTMTNARIKWRIEGITNIPDLDPLYRYTDASNLYYIYIPPTANAQHRKIVAGTDTAFGTADSTHPANTWYLVEELVTGSSHTASFNGANTITGTDTSFSSGYIGLRVYGATTHAALMDWVFVGKYVSPEPAHGAWGSEETSGQSLSFEKNESTKVQDSGSVGKAMTKQFDQLSCVFDELFQNLARSFMVSEMTKLFDSSRVGLSIANGLSEVSKVLDSIAYGKGLGFLSGELSRAYDSISFGKGLGFLEGQLLKIFDYGSIGKSLGSVKSELVGVLDSMTKGISVGTMFGEFGRIFDNLQATFQISGLGQQLSFLQSELISFTPIYGDPYGWLINNAWLTNNPWTVINYGISSTGGDVSLQVSMGLAKGMGEFFGLFDLGRLNFAVSNFVAVMTKIYDETLWNLARPFTMSEFSGMFDKMLSGIGKGVQFGEIGRFFDTNVLGKGLSFVKSELNNVFDRALLGLGKATVFGELGKAFDYGFMNRAIPVSFFEFSKVWDGSLIGKGMAKLSFELTRIFDYSASSKSLGISSSELARIFDLKAFGFSIGKLSGEFTYVFDNFAIGRSMSIPVLGNLVKVFDAMTSNFARSFQMFELFKVFDSSSASRGLGFLNSEFSKLFDNLDIGKGMGLGRGEFAKVWDSQSFGKGLGFTRSELSKVFDSITMGKGLGFLKSEFSTMFDSIVVGKGMGKSFGELSKVFDNLQTVLQTVGPKALSFSFDELSEMFDDGISAIGKTSVFSELSRIFDYANMVRAVSFLQSELISFTPIYGDPYGWFVGNAWLESSPWTILSNGISSTGGDVSLQVSMSLARGMGDFFGLFDLGGLKVAVSNFMGVMTKVYDGMVQNLARPFVMSELSNVFDKLLFGVGKGVQFSEIGRVFDTNVLGKGLGFMRSELVKVFDFASFNKAIPFSFSELSRVFDNFAIGKSLSSLFGEFSYVFDYIRTVFQLSGPQSYVFRFYEFARGFDAIYRTVFISRGLTSLMTIFSGLSENVLVIRNVYGSTYIYAILGRQSIFSRSVSAVVSIATSVVSRVPFAMRIIGQDILTITGLNVVSPSVVPPVVGPVLTGPSVIVTAEFIIRSTWTTGTFTCSILQLLYDNVPLTVQMEVYNKQTVPADITLKYYVTEGNYTVIINGTSYGVANIGGVRSDTIHIEANGTTVRNLVVDVPVRDNVFTFERTYAFHIFATYPNETTTEIVKQIKVSYTVIYAQVGLMIFAFVILGVVFKKRKGLKKIWKALTEEVTSAQRASNRKGASSRRAASK